MLCWDTPTFLVSDLTHTHTSSLGGGTYGLLSPRCTVSLAVSDLSGQLGGGIYEVLFSHFWVWLPWYHTPRGVAISVTSDWPQDVEELSFLLDG